jgi:hypothetical protein
MTVLRAGESRSLLRSRKRSARTPPSTFLFLPIHFSNSPGNLAAPASRRTGKPTKLKSPSLIGDHSSLKVRSFETRPQARKRTARRMRGFIWADAPRCQLKSQEMLRPRDGRISALKRFFTSCFIHHVPHLSHIPPPFFCLLGSGSSAERSPGSVPLAFFLLLTEEAPPRHRANLESPFRTGGHSGNGSLGAQTRVQGTSIGSR